MASASSSAERVPAPSSSIAAVMLATPNLPGRIGGAAGADDEIDLRERHFVLLDDPDGEAVGQLLFLNRRAASAPAAAPGFGGVAAIGLLLGRRQRAHRRRTEQREPITKTRRDRRTHCFLRQRRSARRGDPSAGIGRPPTDVGRAQRAVARQILLEEVRHARARVIRVQLIGLAAEAADALHAAVEDASIWFIVRAISRSSGGVVRSLSSSSSMTC